MAKVGGTATSSGIVNVGFAKLQGENFEYYMQTYSIILGRNSKKSAVDVDLQSLGGGPNISRLHARLFYDFERRNFALEVIGRDGCLVQGVFYSPGNHHVELRSQYLLQFGDLKFYFLLPKKSIFAFFAEQRSRPDPVVPFVLPTGENQLLENEGKEGNGEEELADDQIRFLKKETGSLQKVVRNYAISTGFMNKAGSSVSGRYLEFISYSFFPSSGSLMTKDNLLSPFSFMLVFLCFWIVGIDFMSHWCLDRDRSQYVSH